MDINAHIRDLRKQNDTVDVLEILPIQQLFGKECYMCTIEYLNFVVVVVSPQRACARGL